MRLGAPLIMGQPLGRLVRLLGRNTVFLALPDSDLGNKGTCVAREEGGEHFPFKSGTKDLRHS
jgi:hypothetical protein